MPQRLSLEQFAEAVATAPSAYLPGSAAEPTPLLDHWRQDPERTRQSRLLTSFVPGINPLAPADFHPDAVVTGLFMQPALRGMQASGRFRHLPVSYAGFVRHVRSHGGVDTCVVHVAPPDAAGRCSLGPAVEFTPLMQARSRRTVAILNPLLPALPGAAWLPYDALDAVMEAEFAPKGYLVGEPNRSALDIAGHVAGFIDDGCTLQVGLGKVPDALMSLLHGRRGLRLHSGMLADSALDLWHSGALDPDAQHASCVWVGSAGLYRRLAGMEGPVVQGCEMTHDVRRLAAMPKLRAVNSALSLDLFGQANLELADGQAVSGLGGAADFARGAQLSEGGLSIVALPASYDRGRRSRIVPRLPDGLASLSRQDVDVVVTEHGAADLRGLDVHERAAALTAIADPAFQGALADAWRDTGGAL